MCRVQISVASITGSVSFRPGQTRHFGDDKIAEPQISIPKDQVKDELRQSGVLQKLIVIGEAAARLSTKFKEQHPEIEWADIVGFRNIAVQVW